MAGPRIAVVAAHLLHDLRRRVEAVTVGDVLRGPGDIVRQRIEAPRHVIAERRRLTVTTRLRRAQSAVVVAIAHHVRRRDERALIEYAHPVESVLSVARLLRLGPPPLRSEQRWFGNNRDQKVRPRLV